MRTSARWSASALLACATVAPALAGEPVPAKKAPDVAAAIAALSAPEPAARRRAAEDLVAAYPEGTRAVPALVEARSDEDPGVREAVERTLRAFAEAAFVDAERMVATEIVGKTDSPDLEGVRLLAALDAATLGIDVAHALEEGFPLAALATAAISTAREVIHHVLTWALDSEDARARRGAAAALGLLGSATPAPKVAKDVADAEVRLARILDLAKAAPRRDPRAALASPEFQPPDGATALKWLAGGILLRAPGLGDEATGILTRIAADEGKAASAEAFRALRRAAQRSPTAAAALVALAPRKAQWEEQERLEASAKEAHPRAALEALRASDPWRRTVAARLLASHGHATQEVLDLLLADVRVVDERPDATPSLTALGRAGAAAKDAIPLVESVWNRWTQGGTAPAGPGRVLVAWVRWRLVPSAVEARRYLVRALRAESGRRPDGTRAPTYEAVAEASRLLAESGDALVDVAPEVASALLENSEVPNAHRLVEAIGGLGAAAAPATPGLLGILRRETKTLRDRALPFAERERGGSAGRMRLMAEMGEEYEKVVHPALALSVVRALERVGAPSPEVDAALADFEGVAREPAARVAVARARRVLAARAAATPPR